MLVVNYIFEIRMMLCIVLVLFFGTYFLNHQVKTKLNITSVESDELELRPRKLGWAIRLIVVLFMIGLNVAMFQSFERIDSGTIFFFLIATILALVLVGYETRNVWQRRLTLNTKHNTVAHTNRNGTTIITIDDIDEVRVTMFDVFIKFKKHELYHFSRNFKDISYIMHYLRENENVQLK